MRYALTLLATLAIASTAVARQTPSPAPTPGRTEMLNLGLRGVYFVENQGQWSDASVYYGFKTRGMDIAFRESSFAMHLAREITEASPKRERGILAPQDASRVSDDLTPLVSRDMPPTRDSEDSLPAWDHLTLTVFFPDSNDVRPEAANAQSAKFNYFIGDDESKWASNVPSFGEVVYRDLYDGIDLHISGDAGASASSGNVLKYEFHVAPGADWSPIRIAYDGIDSLCVDPTGELQIATSLGILTDAAPMVWQENRGAAVPAVEEGETQSAPIGGRDARITTIPARFELIDDHTYRIVLDGPVDPREIIIDPDVEWMMYAGGSDDDNAYEIALDRLANVFLVGHTDSVDFDGQNNSSHGYIDAYVTKFNAAGALEWMTSLGGISKDRAYSVATDRQGNVHVAGETGSGDFEGRINLIHGGGDVFVTKVDPAGQLLWMRFLGGSGNDGDADIGGRAVDLAVDLAGNTLVTGNTSSLDFEGATNSPHGSRDAFAAKISQAGDLMWATYLGGSSFDIGRGIAVDRDGNAYVTGDTQSANFEGRLNGLHEENDSLVVRINPDGEVQWMLYLGGTSFDYGLDAATDSEGNAWVTGKTQSMDFEGANNEWQGGHISAYAAKVAPTGSLIWATFLGSGTGFNITLDPREHAFVVGLTSSDQFRGQINERHGGFDAFALRMDSSSHVEWMLYLGGADVDIAYGIAANRAGDAFVGGHTRSDDFEGRINSYHGSGEIWGDGFVARINVATHPVLMVDATCPVGGPAQVRWSGAAPNGLIALLFERNQGSGRVPNARACAGTILGLAGLQLQIAFTRHSDATGSGAVDGNAGPAACGGYLQLLDLSTCSTSNVARIE